MKTLSDAENAGLPLLLGIRILDEEHAQLFRLISRLREAEQRDSLKDRAATIRATINFAKLHFAEEERAMAAADFAEIDSHRAEHQQLLWHLESVAGNCESANDMAVSDVAATLYSWVYEHLLKTDSRYVECLQKMASSSVLSA